MDPVIIAALITAAAGIIAAYVAKEKANKEKARADAEEEFRREAMDVIEEIQPDEIEIFYDFDRSFIDIKENGSCSIKRVVKLVPTKQSNHVRVKKFILLNEGIDFYLSKTGKAFNDIKPDEEFGIVVRDVKNDIRLNYSTEIKGEKRDKFITTVVFYNSLIKDHPELGEIELEITYAYLDVSFFWKKLWGEKHLDEWYVEVPNPVKSYELEILFPEMLPSWFRATNIGTTLIPNGWTAIKQDVLHGRKRLLFNANNLQHNENYTIVIDIG